MRFLVLLVVIVVLTVAVHGQVPGTHFGATLSLTGTALFVGTKEIGPTTDPNPPMEVYAFPCAFGVLSTSQTTYVDPRLPACANCLSNFGQSIVAMTDANGVASLVSANTIAGFTAGVAGIPQGKISYYTGTTASGGTGIPDPASLGPNEQAGKTFTIPTTVPDGSATLTIDAVGLPIAGAAQGGVTTVVAGCATANPNTGGLSPGVVYWWSLGKGAPTVTTPFSKTLIGDSASNYIIGQAVAASPWFFALSYTFAPSVTFPPIWMDPCSSCDAFTCDASNPCLPHKVRVYYATFPATVTASSEPTFYYVELTDPDVGTSPTTRSTNNFGRAISMIDNFLVAGAPNGNSGCGKVFIYARTVTDLSANGPTSSNDNDWSLASALTQVSPTAANLSQFGNTVAIAASAAPNVKFVLAVGAPQCGGQITANGNAYTSGCVYIYTAGTFSSGSSDITYQTYGSLDYVRISSLVCKKMGMGNGPVLALWSTPAPTSGALTTGSVTLAIGTPYAENEERESIHLCSHCDRSERQWPHQFERQRLVASFCADPGFSNSCKFVSVWQHSSHRRFSCAQRQVRVGSGGAAVWWPNHGQRQCIHEWLCVYLYRWYIFVWKL